jgi:hypothetical protein
LLSPGLRASGARRRATAGTGPPETTHGLLDAVTGRVRTAACGQRHWR